MIPSPVQSRLLLLPSILAPLLKWKIWPKSRFQEIRLPRYEPSNCYKSRPLKSGTHRTRFTSLCCTFFFAQSVVLYFEGLCPW